MYNLISKNKAAFLVLIIATIVSVSAFADYDRDKVVAVMRDNVALMGEINSAAEAEDWVLAAQKLFAIADGMVEIMKYDPPRGSKEDWTATMSEFVYAAYRGIGACGEMDPDGLQESISTLRRLNREGHGDHK